MQEHFDTHLENTYLPTSGVPLKATSFLQPAAEPMPVKGKDCGNCVGSIGVAAMGNEDDCMKGRAPEPHLLVAWVQGKG